MEKILVKCQSEDCGRKFKVPGKFAGKKIKCPGCKNPVRVPEVVSDMGEDEIELADEPTKASAKATAKKKRPSSRKSPKQKPAKEKAVAMAREEKVQLGEGKKPSAIESGRMPEAGRPTNVDSAEITPPPQKPISKPIPEPAAAEPKFTPIATWIQDIVTPRKQLRTALRWTLLGSFAIHLCVTAVIPRGSQISQQDLERYESDYNKKISAAKNAKIVAGSIKKKVLTVAPPPDPEGVVEDTINESIKGDMETVIGEMLTVEVKDRLAKKISVSLKDEIEAAAKDIAAGNMSEEDIEKFHKNLQKKAHNITVTELREHRIDTQEERAELTTTEWYEKKLSKTLIKNIYFQYWTPPGYNRHPPSPRLWAKAYGGVYYGRDKHLSWGDLRAQRFIDPFPGKLLALLKGNPKVPATREPGKTQASYLKGHLQLYFNGAVWKKRFTFQGALPSWKQLMYGTLDTQTVQNKPYQIQLTSGLLREFYPHRLQEIRPIIQKAEEAFKDAIAKAQAYVEAAEGDEAAMKAAQQASVESIKKLAGLLGKLRTGEHTDHGRGTNLRHRYVNALVRNKVLANADLQKEMYEYYVKKMVDGLWIVVQEMIKDEFGKSIIIPDGDAKKAIKEFPGLVIPLIERDVKALLPFGRFKYLSYGSGYPFLSYKHPITKHPKYSPNKGDYAKEAKALENIVKKNKSLAEYAVWREKLNKKQWKKALDQCVEVVMTQVHTGNLLTKSMNIWIEGVDTADKVKERLDSRQAALQGRGQDMARLTSAGVPDTSAPLLALKMNAGLGGGVSLTPTVLSMEPGFIAPSIPALSLRASKPSRPGKGAGWGFTEQPSLKNPYKNSPIFETIPFLPKIPRIDGKLNDWGTVRPLVLKSGRGQAVSLVAGWNYQGLFFGYKVKQHKSRFYYSSKFDSRGSRLSSVKWAMSGDYLSLMFDTLDARSPTRGEAHLQEFIILPMGTTSSPMQSGIERIVASRRDAKKKQYRGIVARGHAFPTQPIGDRPDGSGPFRKTIMGQDGYSVEVFIPRTLFKVPVFAPGWSMGFNARVAMGSQGGRSAKNVSWSSGTSDQPSRWGDLMLLGTDPRFYIQNADPQAALAKGIFPGHSYLITIQDPDRNVSSATIDSVVVSAEVSGSGSKDVEVFVVKETGKNTGLFRGYVDTQAGLGGEVLGVLEVTSGQQVRFAYVDFGNAKGKRNVPYIYNLPVVSSLMRVSGKK